MKTPAEMAFEPEMFTPEEFDAEMRAIDAMLKAREVQIPGRPLAAMGALQHRHGFQVLLGGPSTYRKGAPYTIDFMFGHVQAWYSGVYGDRLQVRMPFSAGRLAFLIQGDLWTLELPSIVGPVTYIVRKEPGPHNLEHGQCNILDRFHGMTVMFRERLTTNDMVEIMYIFMMGLGALQALKDVKPTPLTELARADHGQAVEHLSTLPAHSGLSRWASLQAVEKLLKAFLEVKTGHFAHIHVLEDLRKAALPYGLSGVSPADVAAVQCKADVRYTTTSTKREAVLAHHAAMRLTATICRALPPRHPAAAI